MPFKANLDKSASKSNPDSPASANKSREMKRRRKQSSSSSEEEEVEIDEKILKCAADNNLTSYNIKSILKRVVSNDQVLAICKFKAEEMERQKQEEQKNLMKQLLIDLPEGTKLTRQKAKELNHDVLPVKNLQTPEPNEELAVLISGDLPEDDEDDDEFNLNDEELVSDDDFTTTCSDIESQPRTPAETIVNDENEIQYDKEGFKVPMSPSVVKEENVAKRTRSKVSLNTIPIEVIETLNPTVLPPGLTTDIYETDPEIDNAWEQFLTEYQQPLNNVLQEEDDDADTEYDSDGQVPNYEDDKRIKVHQRELQALIDDLMDDIGRNLSNELQGQINDEEANTYKPNVEPMHIESKEQTTQMITCTQNYSAINEPSFIPETMSTPIKFQLQNPSLTKSYQKSPSQFVLGPDKSLYVTIPSQMIDYNEVQNTVIESQQSEICPDVINIDFTAPSKDIFSLIEEKKFSFVPNPEIDEERITGTGFTDFQLQILRQQMMMHVQLTTQLYFEFYSNPHYWELADRSTKILTELVEVCGRIEPLMGPVKNLKLAIKFCNDWRKDLDEYSEENRQLIESLKTSSNKFPPRMMERLVTSKVFCFPFLIPRKPFGPPRDKKNYFYSDPEKHLFTLLFDEYQKENRRALSMRLVLVLIRRDYCPWRPLKSLEQLFSSQRNLKKMNYIKYYFEYKKPAKVHHKLEEVNLDRLLPPAGLPRGTLPTVWDKHIFSTERIRRVYKKMIEDEKAAKAKPVKPKDECPKQTDKTILEETPTVQIDYNNYILEFNLPNGGTVLNLDPRILVKNLVDETTVPVNTEPRDLPILNNETQFLIHENNRDKSIGKEEMENKLDSKSKIDLNESKYISKNRKPTRKKFTKHSFANKKRLKIKLHRILANANRLYDKNIDIQTENQISTKIFYYIKEFDIFAALLFRAMKAGPKKQKTDERTQENERHRHQDDPDTSPKILNRNEDLIERDTFFAWKFFDKVEKTFTGEGSVEKMDKFISILTTFKSDRDNVAHLYNKLEDLFLPDHPELAEVLLTFLLPGHAAQVGQFFEHFILTNKENSVEKLENYFEKRSSQMDKIYTMLNELSCSKEEGLTMATIKQKFLPLLKDNQLLIDWFLQLFPNERIVKDQENKFDISHLKKINTFKEHSSSEIYFDTFKSPNSGMKFIQGRICYGDRVILPADLCSLAITEEETECLENFKLIEKPGTSKESAPHINPQERHEVVKENITQTEDLKGNYDSAETESNPLCQDSSSDPNNSQSSTNKEKPLESESTQVIMENKSSVLPLTIETPTENQQATNQRKRKRNCLDSSSTSSESDASLDNNLSIVSTEDDETKTSEWTRDEDKLILGEINSETDSEETIINNLLKLIPHRSQEDIVHRFQFLINVLKELHTHK